MQRIYYRSILLFIIVVFFGCEYKDFSPNSAIPSVDCSISTLDIAVTEKGNPTSCNLIDGHITVEAMGGLMPYAYSLNGGVVQTSNGFSNLGPGVYTMTVKDRAGCTRTVAAELTAPGSNLNAAVSVADDTDCLSGSGTVSVTASGGTGPYTFQFGTGPFTAADSYSGLKHGIYTITVKDATDCPKAVSFVIGRGTTGVSYETDIKPIITKSCAISGCHNGENGASRNWTVLANLQKNALNIKTRTGNRSMPLTGSLTDSEIGLIACWVDDGAKNN